MNEYNNPLWKPKTQHTLISCPKENALHLTSTKQSSELTSSASKTIKLGPLSVTLNGRKSGVRASIALPGTGLSKRNIKIF